MTQQQILEQVLRDTIGDLMIQNAKLITQVEVLKAQVAALQQVKPEPQP